MALKFNYSPRATPLDPDEIEGLIPTHIQIQGQLNAWELQNILEGEQWAFGRRHKDLLSIEFVCGFHKRMFGNTWRWAGKFRTTEKNIGVDPAQIASELKKLCGDVAYQVEHGSYPLDEIAARFHHRLTWIHPFPNGNGRHARTITDVFLVARGAPRFTWGEDDLVAAGETRKRYIEALRAADARDYALLLNFVRSGKTV